MSSERNDVLHVEILQKETLTNFEKEEALRKQQEDNGGKMAAGEGGEGESASLHSSSGRDQLQSLVSLEPTGRKAQKATGGEAMVPKLGEESGKAPALPEKPGLLRLPALASPAPLELRSGKQILQAPASGTLLGRTLEKHSEVMKTSFAPEITLPKLRGLFSQSIPSSLELQHTQMSPGSEPQKGKSAPVKQTKEVLFSSVRDRSPLKPDDVRSQWEKDYKKKHDVKLVHRLTSSLGIKEEDVRHDGEKESEKTDGTATRGTEEEDRLASEEEEVQRVSSFLPDDSPVSVSEVDFFSETVSDEDEDDQEQVKTIRTKGNKPKKEVPKDPWQMLLCKQFGAGVRQIIHPTVVGEYDMVKLWGFIVAHIDLPVDKAYKLPKLGHDALWDLLDLQGEPMFQFLQGIPPKQIEREPIRAKTITLEIAKKAMVFRKTRTACKPIPDWLQEGKLIKLLQSIVRFWENPTEDANLWFRESYEEDADLMEVEDFISDMNFVIDELKQRQKILKQQQTEQCSNEGIGQGEPVPVSAMVSANEQTAIKTKKRQDTGKKPEGDSSEDASEAPSKSPRRKKSRKSRKEEQLQPSEMAMEAGMSYERQGARPKMPTPHSENSPVALQEAENTPPRDSDWKKPSEEQDPKEGGSVQGGAPSKGSRSYANVTGSGAGRNPTTGRRHPARPQTSQRDREEEEYAYWESASGLASDDRNPKKRFVVRFTYKGDDPEKGTRKHLIKILLKEYLNFPREDVVAVIQLPGSKEIDFCIASERAYQKFWICCKGLMSRHETLFQDYEIVPLYRGDTKVLTIILRTTTIPAQDIATWISRYADVLMGPEKKRDEDGIWTGEYRAVVAMRRGNTSIPKYFFLGSDRGITRFSGQPPACYHCGGYDHLRRFCPTSLCSRCAERGHDATSCRKGIVCNLCGISGHVYYRCPEAYYNQREWLDKEEEARESKKRETRGEDEGEMEHDSATEGREATDTHVGRSERPEDKSTEGKKEKKRKDSPQTTTVRQETISQNRFQLLQTEEEEEGLEQESQRATDALSEIDVSPNPEEKEGSATGPKDQRSQKKSKKELRKEKRLIYRQSCIQEGFDLMPGMQLEESQRRLEKKDLEKKESNVLQEKMIDTQKQIDNLEASLNSLVTDLDKTMGSKKDNVFGLELAQLTVPETPKPPDIDYEVPSTATPSSLSKEVELEKGLSKESLGESTEFEDAASTASLEL